jgi:hypothetical protein
MAISTSDFGCDACHHFGVGENVEVAIPNDIQTMPPSQNS